ncbi:hypothetical protein C8Q80DRAFT_1273761 [Daedaleopsis nitida]|nr:hypothetical protein C8Q80DRAFT_1273761 [Daedaleopsis nitida]
MYALAGRFYLDPVAVAGTCSPSTPRRSYTSSRFGKMGAMYYKRLLDLHKTCRTAIKVIVLRPPKLHPTTTTCREEGQRELMKICATAAAELACTGLDLEYLRGFLNLSTYALRPMFEKQATGLRAAKAFPGDYDGVVGCEEDDLLLA